jgi:ABC-type ATPase involved in cell division
MQEPDLLLADEPTSSLDLKTSIEIMELVSNGESHIVPADNCYSIVKQALTSHKQMLSTVRNLTTI